MFKRIYAMMLAVILLLSVLVTGVSYTAMRTTRLSERLEQLTADAR